MTKRTGVLIHGRHVKARGWEDIVWGNPAEGILGQVPKGLLLALAEDVSLIYWGTGASERDGLKESEYTFQYTLDHGDDLRVLPEFDIFNNWGEIGEWVKNRSFIDKETQNTTQEVERAAKMCMEKGILRLYLVSSPSHIARCHMEALKLQAAGKISSDLEIMATASQTPFANSTLADVAIFEPPHRGDDPMIDVDPGLWPSRVLPRIFKLPVDKRVELLARLNQELPKT